MTGTAMIDPDELPQSSPAAAPGAVLTTSELDGVHPASDWGHWLRRGRGPESRYAPPSTERWVEDLAQLADLGVVELSLTLEWAAMEPQAGNRDEEAVEALQERFRLARGLGLEPWGCVVDGTLPGWFVDDEHGFTDDRARNVLWTAHLDWLTETFGDLVSGWIPFREPIHHILRNHLLGWGPPGRHDLDATAKEVRATILAEGEAWRVLVGSAPVATYQTARQFAPVRTDAGHDNVVAAEQVRYLEQLLTTSWSTALTEGEIGLDGYPTACDHLTEAFDRVIVQLRPPVRIDQHGAWSPADRGFLLDGLLTGFESTMNRLDTAQRPVTAAADLAPVPDDGNNQLDHLGAMIDGSHELGAVGWWQASPIDGWQWERGFDAPAGIIDADRSPKTVAGSLAELTA